MSQKRVTIQDVAKQAGVSITTVSRYLNRKFDAMGEDTKERISQVIEELQYRPNALAQGLKSNQSGMIAVIVVNISYPYCVSLIQTLSNRLSPAGYNVLVCETGGDGNREAHVLSSLISRQVDGIIIQTNGDNNAAIGDIALQIPVVLVDRQFEIKGTSCVVTNNRDASFELTDYLFGEGYKSVLFVTETEGCISTRVERKAGYVDACRNRNQEPWIGFVNRSRPLTFIDIAREIQMVKHQSPFAVYTANGLLMMQLLRELQGIQPTNGFVQHGVGFATFDEPDWVGIVSPSLTCVHQPVEQIGEWAAKVILTRIARGQAAKRTQKIHVITSKLIFGESTRLKESNES